MYVAGLGRSGWLAASVLAFWASACGRIGYDPSQGNADASLFKPDADPGDVRLSCAGSEEQVSLAIFNFDEDPLGVVLDSAGPNSGRWVGVARYVEGPSADCGQAVSFAGVVTDHVVIPDAPEWQIPTGSIDFWFRVASIPDSASSIVSRDALGTDFAGHINVLVSDEQRLGVRVQRMGAGTDVGVVCSSPGSIFANSWNHAGINFGSPGLELWLNSKRADSPGALDGFECQTGIDEGIDGNLNPWVLGAGTGGSDDGSATPVNRPFDGSIDHFRISATRRDFSGRGYSKPAP